MPIMSLDGYVADEAGNFDWAMPDDEVFGFVNDFERPVGTYLYGRRLYQEMTGWETMDADPGLSPLMLDFARIWQAADRSCTPGRWRRYPPAGRGWSGSSTPGRSGR